MAKTPEGKIKRDILDFLNHIPRGCFWNSPNGGIYDPKTHKFRKTAGRRGVADILGCYKGRFIAIEVKTKTGTLSDYQKVFLEDINRTGGFAVVCRSVEDTIRFFQLIDQHLI